MNYVNQSEVSAAALRSTQSVGSVLVDLAVLAVLVLFVYAKPDPAAWTILSTVVGARFGISAGKMVERAAIRQAAGSGAGPSDRPPPGGPGATS